MSQEVKYTWRDKGAESEPAEEPAQENDNGGYTYVAPETQSTQEPEPNTQPEGETDPQPEAETEPQAETADQETPEDPPLQDPPSQEVERVQEPQSNEADQRPVDPKTQAFLDWQKKTGRSIDEYNERNRDLSALSPLEIARDRIRKENEDLSLSESEIEILLQDELGFDPTDPDLDTRESVAFKKFYGKHLKALQEAQKEYDTPVEGHQPKAAPETPQPQEGEVVKLSNGVEVSAEEYQRQRSEYLAQREESLKELGKENFKVTFDGKDGKREYDYSYDYQDQDRHSMLSITEDVGNILNTYQSETGEFDHASFNKDLWWTRPENRNKAISAIIAKVRSDVIDEQISQRRNLNFDSPTAPQTNDDSNKGYHKVGESTTQDSFSVRFPFKKN